MNVKQYIYIYKQWKDNKENIYYNLQIKMTTLVFQAKARISPAGENEIKIS